MLKAKSLKHLLLVFFFPLSIFGQMSALIDTIPKAVYDPINDKWLPSIMKSKGMLKDSLKVGVWQSFYDNGQVADSGEYRIADKIKIILMDSASQAIYHYVDTNYIKTTFKKKYSVPTGTWVEYNRNGTLKSAGTYLPVAFIEVSPPLDDIDNPGNLLYSWSLPWAMKTGIWKYFNEQGKLEQTEVYKNGILIGDK